ncbi:MAG: OadG family protein [Bacteroidales bacterium]
MIPFLIITGTVLTTDSIVIAMVGYVVVFASLVLLFWLFNILPKLIYMNYGRKQKIRGKSKTDKQELGIPGETTAAISLALHIMLSELHDEESGILTIKKVSKSYSPWSSKIYAVRNQFNRI